MTTETAPVAPILQEEYDALSGKDLPAWKRPLYWSWKKKLILATKIEACHIGLFLLAFAYPFFVMASGGTNYGNSVLNNLYMLSVLLLALAIITLPALGIAWGVYGLTRLGKKGVVLKWKSPGPVFAVNDSSRPDAPCVTPKSPRSASKSAKPAPDPGLRYDVMFAGASEEVMMTGTLKELQDFIDGMGLPNHYVDQRSMIAMVLLQVVFEIPIGQKSNLWRPATSNASPPSDVYVILQRVLDLNKAAKNAKTKQLREEGSISSGSHRPR